MRRMMSIMIAGLVLLTSVAAPAGAMSTGFHGAPGAGVAARFDGPLPPRLGGSALRGSTIHFQTATIRTPVALPESRKSCYRHRLRQLLQLGHDYDLAQEEALLICG